MSIVLEDLIPQKMKIYQDTEGFRFGTDSVLLAWFAARKRANTLCDLCSGNGAVGFLYSAVRTDCKITMLELLENQSALAKMTADYNKISDKTDVVCGDLRRTNELLPCGFFDAVTVNPPYMTASCGFDAKGDKKQARAETECTLDDVMRSAEKILKFGGTLYCVIKSDRLTDALCAMRNNTLEPKELVLVSSKPENAPYIALIEAKKGGGHGLSVKKPIILAEDGKDSYELREIYASFGIVR